MTNKIKMNSITKIKRVGGFSILETIIAMTIFTIIAIAIVTFQLNIFSLNQISSDNLLAQEDARRALRDMSSEIRSMCPSDMGAYPIAQAATSSLIFYENIDDDSQIERVRYFLVGTTLKKGVIKPTGTPPTYNPSAETTKELVHNIANGTGTIFSYYDSNYDGTSPPLADPVDVPSVRLIKINIVIDNNIQELPQPLILTTQASIRNIKDNL